MNSDDERERGNDRLDPAFEAVIPVVSYYPSGDVRMTFGKGMTFNLSTVTALTGAALLLSGCGPHREAIEDCERHLLKAFRDPSAYTRVDTSAKDLSHIGIKQLRVAITYDVPNDTPHDDAGYPSGELTRKEPKPPLRYAAICSYLYQGDTKKADLTSVARLYIGYIGRDAVFEGRMAQMRSLPKDERDPNLFSLFVLGEQKRARLAEEQMLEKESEAMKAQYDRSQGQKKGD